MLQASTFYRVTPLLLILQGGLVLLSGGCQRDDGIRSYNVPKSVGRPAAEVPLAASANDAWFFKLTGPRDEVLRQMLPFTNVVRTLKLTEGAAPEFQVPPGWTESSGPPPRYKTLTLDASDPELELTISSLPFPGTGYEGYLLANLNRWRGQLGLEPLSGENALETARENGELMIIPSQGNMIAVMNLTGETKEFGDSRMLAAVVTRGTEAAAAPASSPPVESPLTYEVPAGWQKSTGNAMRLASFEVADERGPADVSVTRFPGGGDVLANVNRWREQVKLEPLEAAALEEQQSTLTIAGREGIYIEALGDEQAILAAIVPDEDVKWFFKMQGPQEVVKEQREQFRKFLSSVTLQGP